MGVRGERDQHVAQFLDNLGLGDVAGAAEADAAESATDRSSGNSSACRSDGRPMASTVTAGRIPASSSSTSR